MDTNFPTVPGYDGTYLQYPYTFNDDSGIMHPTNNTAEPPGQQLDLLSTGMEMDFATLSGYDEANLVPVDMFNYSETLSPRKSTAKPLEQQQDLFSTGTEIDIATLSGDDQANLFPPDVLSHSEPMFPRNITAEPPQQQQGPGTGKQPQPSALDWFIQRPLIEKLYRSHDLKYVMGEMKQRQNFHA
ncbi:MAG: hypothetical protein Q9183_007083, partial [Haloplaca sp. 2 TL-2023]